MSRQASLKLTNSFRRRGVGISRYQMQPTQYEVDLHTAQMIAGGIYHTAQPVDPDRVARLMKLPLLRVAADGMTGMREVSE